LCLSPSDNRIRCFACNALAPCISPNLETQFKNARSDLSWSQSAASDMPTGIEPEDRPILKSEVLLVAYLILQAFADLTGIERATR